MRDRPDWKNAPEWANWLVCNSPCWYWCENEPKWSIEMFKVRGGQVLFAGDQYRHTESQKEKRPC